jgi:hypothetical protein
VTISLTSQSLLKSQISQVQTFSVEIEDDSNEERHTRFLSIMIEMNKTFRISCSVIQLNNEFVNLDKTYTQADQEFDMNVVSTELVRLS